MSDQELYKYEQLNKISIAICRHQSLNLPTT